MNVPKINVTQITLHWGNIELFIETHTNTFIPWPSVLIPRSFQGVTRWTFGLWILLTTTVSQGYVFLVLSTVTFKITFSSCSTDRVELLTTRLLLSLKREWEGNHTKSRGCLTHYRWCDHFSNDFSNEMSQVVKLTIRVRFCETFYVGRTTHRFIYP